MKSKIISELKNGLKFPQSRGEIAAQEQIRIFEQAMTTSTGEPQGPKNQGEVAAQEQIRIFGQAFAIKGEPPRAPTTRGEIAAQEQMRIIGQATGNFIQNTKTEAESINYVRW